MTIECLLECYYNAGRVVIQSYNTVQSGFFWFRALRSTVLHTKAKSGLIPEGTLPYPGPVDARQVQRIRTLAENLKTTADRMQIRHANRSLNPRDMQGLSDEEIRVVRRIYESGSTNLYIIARHLKACLTPRTFHMVLQFLRSNVSTNYGQLAAACEVVTLLFPSFQQAIQAGRIYDMFKEFINDKLDEVLR